MQILIAPFLAFSLALGATQDGQDDEPPQPEPKQEQKQKEAPKQQEVEPKGERPRPATGDGARGSSQQGGGADATERRPQRPPIVRTERRDARPVGTGPQGGERGADARPAGGVQPAGQQGSGARPAGRTGDGAGPDAKPVGRRDVEEAPAGGASGVGEAQGRNAQRVPGSRGTTPGEATPGGEARPGETPADGPQPGGADPAGDRPAGQGSGGERPAAEDAGAGGGSGEGARPQIDRGQARALLQELVHHRERHAKIDKLIAIFETREDEPGAADKIARARELKTKEDARHAAALTRFRGRLGSDAVDAILQQIAARRTGAGAGRGAGTAGGNADGPGTGARRQDTPPAARGGQTGGGQP